MKERWKRLEGYRTVWISDQGRVKSVKKGKKTVFLKLHQNNCGYLRVALCEGGLINQYLVHRLVAECFIEEGNWKSQVNHLNGIKTDNRKLNLQWCTAQENMQHAYATGLMNPLRSKKIFDS